MKRIKNLKANLEEKIFQSDKVIIVPHIDADFDAIASSVGMSLLVDHFNKENHVLIGDTLCKLNNGARAMVEECQERFPIIGLPEYEKIKGENDFNVLCDVNKPKLTFIKEFDREHLAIIDHHNKDDESFDACIEHYDTQASSASEIITAILSSYRIPIPKEVADMLYAGILLDTGKLHKNDTGTTHRIIAKLMDQGARRDDAEQYFTDDVFSTRKVEKLVASAQYINYRVGLILGPEGKVFKKEELARAADTLLTGKVDATFAVGDIGDGIISISARSNGAIDAGLAMGEIEGGGGKDSAATKLTNTTVEEAGKRLKKVIFPHHRFKEA